jgi:hypothetical protein
MIDLDRDECKIDVHHIFPKRWCKGRGIVPRVFNSILNKTPISYKANRMIGGHAPSEYLDQLRRHPHVQISVDEQDNILGSHLIEPSLMRSDSFAAFLESRKTALLRLVGDAMGKDLIVGGEAPAEDPVDDEEDNEEDESSEAVA